MYDDKRRNLLLEKVDEYVQDQLRNPTLETKVRCIAAITTLLKHAVEVGQAQLSKEGIVPLMLSMAGSDESVQQLVAAEAIIAAAAKKKDTSVVSDIISLSQNILARP